MLYFRHSLTKVIGTLMIYWELFLESFVAFLAADLIYLQVIPGARNLSWYSCYRLVAAVGQDGLDLKSRYLLYYVKINKIVFNVCMNNLHIQDVQEKLFLPQIHWNPRLYIAPRGWSGKKQIYLLSKNAPVSGHFHYWGFMSRNCVQFILYRVYTIVVFIGEQRKKRWTSRRKLITIFAYFTKRQKLRSRIKKKQ